MHDGAVRVFTHEVCDIDQDSVDPAASSPSFYSATLSPRGTYVAAGHSDGTIRIWAVLTGQLVHKLSGHQPWVACVAFMPDGTGLVSGGGDPTMKYWDLGPLETHQRGPQQAGESDLATRDSAAGIQPKVLQEYSGHTVCLIPGSRSCQLDLIHDRAISPPSR